jgi:malonate-semialdehyde dehydrogenase (acetylating)/methylmalonate-semialdehyde dehydrogenase
MMHPSEFIQIRNFLDGEWQDSEQREQMPLYDPSTGKQIGQVPLSTQQDSTAAIESCHEAYGTWRCTSVAKRAAFIFDMRQAMKDNHEDLAQSIALDQAKHISEARGEVQRVIQILETASGIPTLMQGETVDNIAGNIVGRVIKQPLGVFCGVAPFNFPALVFGWFIPFCIGTGNTMVFKPSPLSPYFMQKMGAIFNDIGLPPGVINIINGDHVPTLSWYDDPRVAGICMVGSSPTAKKIAEAAGKAGKRTMLLGGAKNYLVVMEDVQMDIWIEDFIHSCYGSAGQRCLSGSIVAIHEDVHDQVLEKIVEASRKVTYGSAMDPEVYMGPVISAEARDRINGMIEIGRLEDRATLVLDGRDPDMPPDIKEGYYVAPTIFSDVTADMQIARTEIFGPVVSVMKFSNLDDILANIQTQPVGNGACIFTQNLYYTEKFIADANVGMVGVNVGVPAPHPYLPFGGIKDSLIGTNKVQGKDGIDFFTQNKIATVRFSPPSAGRHRADIRTKAAGPQSSDTRSCVPD